MEIWSPNTWFRIYMNGGLDYTNLKAVSLGMSNDGFSGRIFAGSQFTLPKDFRTTCMVAISVRGFSCKVNNLLSILPV